MKKINLIIILLLSLAMPVYAESSKHEVSCEVYNYDLVQLVSMYWNEELTKEFVMSKVNAETRLSKADRARWTRMVNIVFSFPRPKVQEDFEAIFQAAKEPCEVGPQ